MSSSALWLQTAELSASYVKLLTVFVGLLALALVVQAAAVAILASKVVALLTDLKASFDQTKGKALPLIATATDITNQVKGIVADLTPKIKVVTENVVETSHTVRQTVSKLDVTIRQAADTASVTFEDASVRTKAQVARVDSMVSTTLAATAELGATVNEGIRAPARKIATMVTQSKHLVETLLDRAKALGFSIGATVDNKVNPKTKKGGW